MNLLVVLCVLATSSVAGRKSFELNKCCPRNQRLNAELACADPPSAELPDEDAESEAEARWRRELPWFPAGSIVDAGTMQIHEHRSDEYLSILREKYRIRYGRVPDCGDPDEREFAYHLARVTESFNFVMDADGGLTAHVSKSSSYHNPEDGGGFFARVTAAGETFRGVAAPGANGSLRTLPMSDVCVDLLGELSVHVLMFCPCRTMLCIRKCCADDQHFSVDSFGCRGNEDWAEDLPQWRPRTEGVIENYYLLSDTYPSCDVPILLKYQHKEYSSCNRFNKASDNEFVIFPNGSVKVRKYKTLFDTNQYCGEVTVSENGTVEEQNLILCSASRKEEDRYEPITHTLYGVLLIVGGVCLLLTVVVSLFLPSLRRKVHNKIALSHNASLMVANFTMAVPQLFTGLSPKSCVALAFLEQFTLLGSFFWLNVMCIDISMTFSSNRHLKSGRFDGGTKQFAYYSVYAWGSTSLISIATMAMEFNPDNSLDYLKPGFACICGFNTANASMLVYLYGPMTILLVMNLVLFVYTTSKIIGIQRQTAMLHKTDSNMTGGSSFQTDKQRLVLYGKLFLLMGITWIMEVVSWAAGGPRYYWYFSDILNLLRAVFIFVLFVCKRQVFRNLRKRWNGESQSYSDKTGSARSQTDEMAVSTTAQDRGRATARRKGSNRSETDLPRPGKGRRLSTASGVKESPM